MKNENYNNGLNSRPKIIQFERRSISVTSSPSSFQTTTSIISINTRNNLSDKEIYSKIISLTKD
jgi:hypothetical protein